MRVGVYASARDEEKNVATWFDSTQGADVVVVNDTGSTDSTVERFRALGVDVRQEPDPGTAFGRFNLALSLLPEDVDLCIRLDLDERLRPGWREALERVWDPDKFRTDAGCPIGHLGSPVVLRPWFDHGGVTYRHDRIHSRRGFHWEMPIHEVLVSEWPHSVAELAIDVEVTIEHHQDLTKDRTTVLTDLERALAQDPTNLRLLHYLGREYTYYARWAEAIPHLHQHAKSDAFAEERSESWRLLGDCYRALLPMEDVPRRPFFQAAFTAPERREGWLALAEWHFERGDWKEVLTACEHCLAITERHWYFNHQWAWSWKPYDRAAIACYYLGRTDDAIRYGEQALALAPDDPQLVENLRWYRGEVAA